MIKLLIVDDEPIIRDGIKNKIDWESLQLQLAGEAEDGLDALEWLEREQPDIMLTDIRMPELDGLQLVQEAKRKWPDLACVIVSGYNDFEYARQALKYGVEDYLLKPVNDRELNELLADLLVRHRVLAKEREHNRFLQQWFEHSTDESRDLLLTRFVGQDSSVKGTREWTHHWPHALQHGRGFALVFSIEPDSLLSNHSDGDDTPVWKNFRSIVEKHLEDAGMDGIVFRHVYHPQQLVAIVSYNEKEDKNCPDNRKLWIRKALDEICGENQEEATVGIGPILNIDDLAQSYASAAFAVKNKILHGTGNMYSSETYRFQMMPLDADQERYVFSLLDHGQEEQIRNWLDLRFRQLAENRDASFAQLERLYSEIDYLFGKYLSANELQARMPPRVDGDTRQIVQQFASWPDAADELYHQALNIMRMKSERKQRSGEDIASEVKRHIDRQYYENVSLNWVADTYFIHAKYFSKLFKEKYGETFNDYITKVRMEHAAEHLKDPSLSIQQIAALTGYDDPAYFSSVFRKYYGVTPTKYREGSHL